MTAQYNPVSVKVEGIGCCASEVQAQYQAVGSATAAVCDKLDFRFRLNIVEEGVHGPAVEGVLAGTEVGSRGLDIGDTLKEIFCRIGLRLIIRKIHTFVRVPTKQIFTVLGLDA